MGKRLMMQATRRGVGGRRVRLPLARTVVGGRQAEFDGSRLLDCYAVNPQEPESKESTVIYFSPGAVELFRFVGSFTGNYPVGGVAPDDRNGVRGMVAIESAVYGNVLFGVYGRNRYFVVRVKESAELGRGVFSLADWNRLASGGWRGAREGDGGVSYQTGSFTAVQSEFFEDDRLSVRLATDGRRIIWTNYKRGVYGFDLEAWDDEQDGRLTQQQKADRTEEPHGKLVDITAPLPDNLENVRDDEAWVDVGWTDGYFLLASRNQEFFHSTLDSLVFDVLDYERASSKPDPVVGVEVLNRRSYVCGEGSIENWYNSGGGDFAFSRDNAVSMDVGCASGQSIVHVDYGVVFVGSDGIVYMLGPGGLNPLSNETVHYELARSELRLSWFLLHQRGSSVLFVVYEAWFGVEEFCVGFEHAVLA